MSLSAPSSSEKLYSPRLLGLSAELANFLIDRRLQIVVEERSRTCGSTIRMGIDRDAEGRVAVIGLQVSACAVGQSSAAILARSIRGKNLADMETTLDQIESWVSGKGDLPSWPEFDALAPAKAHPGRHGALLMPWKAAIEALSSDQAPG